MTNRVIITTANGGLPAGLQDLTKPTTVDLDLGSGTSTVIVGANGSGKTRLGSYIEQMLQDRSHRIPAQRSIRMTDNVTLQDYDASILRLRFGHHEQRNKIHRWGNDPAINPIDDFEHLLRALFAEKNRALSDDHTIRKTGAITQIPKTKLDQLQKIWETLLPHRKLIIRDAQIKIQPPANPLGEGGDEPYSSTQLSDGERVIFYLIGQSLLAPSDAALIVDEPELHIHPSISAPLWDALESERSDCAFVYFTHDMEFAANRVTARKYFVKSIYRNSFWDIEAIPEDTGLPEQLVIELVGNKKPVLFIEGEGGSLDLLIYRAAYPHMMIEPRGGCESVIHSVASFRANPTLHRLGSVFGCIDADQRRPLQISALEDKGIFTLAVAEIENVFLLPNVFLALCAALSVPEQEANRKLEKVKDAVLQMAAGEAENVAARYVSRRIDSMLKRVTLNRASVADLIATYSTQTTAIDPAHLAQQFKTAFDEAIASKNYELVLKLFDHKGLLSIAVTELGLKSPKFLILQSSRFMLDDKHRALKEAVLEELPLIQ
jgi:ABC-type dipeptide/oligopeptide/nickel transport system ATPase component